MGTSHFNFHNGNHFLRNRAYNRFSVCFVVSLFRFCIRSSFSSSKYIAMAKRRSERNTSL